MDNEKNFRTAAYLRLSREDGDKPESDSIANQKAMAESYINASPDLELAGFFIDDGYTGTNFRRPAFEKMAEAIESGGIDCVLVKDLSRFGRDYIETGRYLERWFPERGVRFISINDSIDSGKNAYDMLLPVKNVFNAQYAKDISQKVKSAFKTKQKRGDFTGAFAAYGYKKDPENHNRLVIDPIAAEVVRRIFDLFESGMGKIAIAKLLNSEKIPCPSEYKRMLGERYHNGRKIGVTTYWTYATVHRMLQSDVYAGNLAQGRSSRLMLHGRAKQLAREEWIVAENTHEAIISEEQWNRVSRLLEIKTREIDFGRNISPFAGYLKCGDCGRAMSKSRSGGGRQYYCCGSYKRYGAEVCTSHRITHDVLEGIILDDINKIIDSVGNLKKLADEARTKPSGTRNTSAERDKIKATLERLYRLKKSSYEDYREGLISKEDYRRYKEDYDAQETMLGGQLKTLEKMSERSEIESPWVENLLSRRKLAELDRITVSEVLEGVKIFEDGRIEITYSFSEELKMILEDAE